MKKRKNNNNSTPLFWTVETKWFEKHPKWSINLPRKKQKKNLGVVGRVLPFLIFTEQTVWKTCCTRINTFSSPKRVRLRLKRKWGKNRENKNKTWWMERRKKTQKSTGLDLQERKKEKKGERERPRATKVDWRSGHFTWLYCWPLQASPDPRKPPRTGIGIYKNRHHYPSPPLLFSYCERHSM